MTPWILLDRAQLPGNSGEFCLYQRNNEFSIKITGRGELMNSRVHGSEDALAEHTCARLVNRATPLKHMFERRAAAMRGDLPKLIKGEAL